MSILSNKVKLNIMRFKIIIYLFLLLSSSIIISGCLPKQKEKINKGGEEKMTDLTNKKILMVIAPQNFRDEEFLKPKAIFEAAGAQITVASKGVTDAQGMLGAKVKVDIDLIQTKAADYDAIVFVGGSGSSVYFNDLTALNLAKEAVNQNKVVGAICIAPSILANAGLLEGRKATAFPSEADNLKAKGANFISQPVVEDGKIITASGPQVAEEFGQKLAEMLK